MNHHVEFDLALRKNPYKGRIICIEGVDGAGKTTQAKAIVKRLNKEGYNASYTKEPTDMLIGQFIREKVLSGTVPMNPIALQYLFNADRVMHMEKIESLLQKGMVIVMDRYFWSAVAYAMADLNGTMQDPYLTMFSVLSFYHQFIAPDFSFFLKISPQVALERIEASGKHNEIYDTQEKLPRIEKAYEYLMNEFKDEFTVVNGERPAEELTEEILKTIKARLTMGI